MPSQAAAALQLTTAIESLRMMSATTPYRAHFSRMDESTPEEWAARAATEDRTSAPCRTGCLAQLRQLDNEHGGFAVDRLTHSLQTAHRAELDGRDEAYLVCALLHDVVTCSDHTTTPTCGRDTETVGARGLPLMVRHHGVFQGYYFWHYWARTPTPATPSRATSTTTSPRSSSAIRHASSILEYSTPPLGHYEPLIRSFFSRPRSS